MTHEGSAGPGLTKSELEAIRKRIALAQRMFGVAFDGYPDTERAPVDIQRDRDRSALVREVERLRDEIADAREACPSIRMQDHFDDPLLTLVNLEVSRGFNRDAEIRRLAALLSPSGVREGVGASPQPVCEWTPVVEDDTGDFETSCGQTFQTLGGEAPDFVKFCCYCGKQAVILPAAPQVAQP